MVTSSAVVGSSAISSLGLQASAMAIITRWRMPPDSWCGYSAAAGAGSAMPTRLSISTARALRRLAIEALVQAQRLADLAADGEHRVEARHRLLEDHADVVAADGAHRAIVERQEVAALEAGLRRRSCPAAPGSRRRIDMRGDRLAAAALADDRERLALLDIERDAVDRAVDAVRRAEMGLQVVDLEQRHGHKPLRRARIERVAQAVAERG